MVGPEAPPEAVAVVRTQVVQAHIEDVRGSPEPVSCGGQLSLGPIARPFHAVQQAADQPVGTSLISAMQLGEPYER